MTNSFGRLTVEVTIDSTVFILRVERIPVRCIPSVACFLCELKYLYMKYICCFNQLLSFSLRFNLIVTFKYYLQQF